MHTAKAKSCSLKLLRQWVRLFCCQKLGFCPAATILAFSSSKTILVIRNPRLVSNLELLIASPYFFLYNHYCKFFIPGIDSGLRFVVLLFPSLPSSHYPAPGQLSSSPLERAAIHPPFAVATPRAPTQFLSCIWGHGWTESQGASLQRWQQPLGHQCWTHSLDALEIQSVVHLGVSPLARSSSSELGSPYHWFLSPGFRKYRLILVPVSLARLRDRGTLQAT